MQVTPLNRTYPARNDAGSYTTSKSSVVVAVANDGPGLVQAVLCRRGEGGDYSVVAVLNLGAGPAPAQEQVVPNEGTADFSVVVLNGTTSDVRAYITGYDLTAPAPAGGATSALQTAGNASLASIDAKLTNPLPVSGSLALSGAVDVTDRAARLLGVVYGSQGQPLRQTATNYNLAVELSAGGTAYDARQTRALAYATDSVTTVPSGTQTVSGSIAVSNLPSTQAVSGSVSVSNFPASQAVTGTFWPTTQPVSASSLPLPTGAATESSLTSLLARLPAALVSGRLSVDGSGVTQPVSVAGSVAVTGTFYPATQPVSGTVTANVGTTGGLALDATLTSGAQKTQLWDGAAVLGVAANPITTTSKASSNATQNNVGVGSTVGTVVLAANASAKYRKIYNWSTTVAYFLYGTSTSTITAGYATFAILPGQTWEMPSSNGQCEYTGVITGNGSGGVVNATEGT